MNFKKDPESMNRDELTKLIADIQKKMQKAAAELKFRGGSGIPRQDGRVKKHAA